MNNARYQQEEFHDWTQEVEETLATHVKQLNVWQNADKEVSKFTVGSPFDTSDGSAENMIVAVRNWIADARGHCEEMLANPEFGYQRYLFQAASNGRLVHISPSMEGFVGDSWESFTLAAAIVVRPTKTTFRFYGTNAKGWQDWKEEEQQIASSSLESLLESPGTESVDEQTPFVSTSSHSGRTYYRVDPAE